MRFSKTVIVMAMTLMVGLLVACSPKSDHQTIQDHQKSSGQKVSLLLDWFVNPNHAAIIVAQQKGYFAEQGLVVDIVEPADPSMPPKLVAAGQADIAVDYQPQLQQQIAEGLPLVRIGTLIDTPLNSLVVLKSSGIDGIKELKGKKIGYSVSGFEELLLTTMLKSANLNEQDVQMVNVNWSLSPSLLSGQVDGVIGAFRNFELNQLKIEQQEGVAFYPETHGVPVYDELIFVVKKETTDDERYVRFMNAITKATDFIKQNPEEAWQIFISHNPAELDNQLNRLAWSDTLPHLAERPKVLDELRYEKMATFMQQQGLIKHLPAVTEYAIQLPE
ncbi:ABC transporter substrate-binding protein [Moraxella sp. Tifton1]|uniref:ABC transporter substrate-binding protein n=1 Tax=Moraxella oculi TaxID=2940516 RepID=UPI00201224B0|nr:ABC transporter substrate-binding protein [Moraxella sp. Tifton1]MCL1623901.1 ABC transporter substrate-binding protein [Moraxella sp. Tifton1]